MVHHTYDHSWVIVCIGNLWVGARPWNKWLYVDGCANCWCATDCYRFCSTQSSCTNCDGLIMRKQQMEKFNMGLCICIDLVVQTMTNHLLTDYKNGSCKVFSLCLFQWWCHKLVQHWVSVLLLQQQIAWVDQLHTVKAWGCEGKYFCLLIHTVCHSWCEWQCLPVSY